MATVNVVPKAGYLVNDPDAGDFLPPGGRTVTLTDYWARRIRDGDVTVSGSPPPPPAPSPPPGGGGGPVDQTIIEDSENAVAGGAVYEALQDKADADGATLTDATLEGETSLNGAIVTGYVGMGSGTEFDIENSAMSKIVTADFALSFSDEPSPGWSGVLRLSNTSGADRTITMPDDCVSMQTQAQLTSFVVPNNAKVDVQMEWDGTNFLVFGNPVPLSSKGLYREIPAGGNDTIVMMAFAMHPGVITKVITDCDSGTATYTVCINGTPIGATANAVSSSQQTRNATSANSFAYGSRITVVRSANASCVNGRVTVEYAPVAP